MQIGKIGHSIDLKREVLETHDDCSLTSELFLHYKNYSVSSYPFNGIGMEWHGTRGMWKIDSLDTHLLTRDKHPIPLLLKPPLTQIKIATADHKTKHILNSIP